MSDIVITNSHDFTTNAMSTESPCDPNIANENIEFLKEEVDTLKQVIPDLITKDKEVWGSLSSGVKTLVENAWHTANYTGSSSINMFTQSDVNKPSIAFVKFKTDNTAYPTFTGATFDYTPAWDTTNYNLVTIFTDDGTHFFANHRVLGA